MSAAPVPEIPAKIAISIGHLSQTLRVWLLRFIGRQSVEREGLSD